MQPQFRIERPCHERWDKMRSDAGKKFCDSCACFVHDATKLSSAVLQRLIEEEQEVCVRIENHRIEHIGWMGSVQRKLNSIKWNRIGAFLATLLLLIACRRRHIQGRMKFSGICRDMQNDRIGAVIPTQDSVKPKGIKLREVK